MKRLSGKSQEIGRIQNLLHLLPFWGPKRPSLYDYELSWVP